MISTNCFLVGFRFSTIPLDCNRNNQHSTCHTELELAHTYCTINLEYSINLTIKSTEDERRKSRDWTDLKRVSAFFEVPTKTNLIFRSLSHGWAHHGVESHIPPGHIDEHLQNDFITIYQRIRSLNLLNVTALYTSPVSTASLRI